MAIGDTAKYLGVARKTIYKWVESGQIPFVRIGRLIRFREKDLDEWIESSLHRPKDIADRKACR